MIGNGFDKQLGLATGYDQFVNWYIQQPSKNEKIRHFKEELKNNPQPEWWSDAEIAMGRYVNNFSSDTLPVFFDLIEDFKRNLVVYLREQDGRCDFSDAQTIGDGFADFLLNFQDDIALPKKVGRQFSRDNGIIFNFLTFNYTNALARLIDITKATRPDGVLHRIQSATAPQGLADCTIGNIFSVHGDLNSLLVMGVNDESQIDFPLVRITTELSTILVKSQYIEFTGHQETAEGVEVLNSSDIIAIFGLRLGNSDAVWRERLWTWFQDPLHYVVLFGNDNLPNADSPVFDTTLRYVDKKQIEFLVKLKPDIDPSWRDFCRNKIFVVPQTTHLNLNLIHE